MKKSTLKNGEFESYFGRYVDLVPSEVDLVEGLTSSQKESIGFYKSIPRDKLGYRYEKGKWTINEVLQHVIDTERIFGYRLFRIGRNDQTPLASFDQNLYVTPSGANRKSMDELLSEYSHTRAQTLAIIQSLTDIDLAHKGISSNHPLSARAAGFIILGHEKWHIQIIQERYLG